MSKEDPKIYCFLARRDLPCIKISVAKRHLPYYDCEKCIWRIHSEDDRNLKSLEKIFQKYGEKMWK